MPELPEVETVRLGLLKKLPGKKVVDVKVLRPDSIGFPEPAQFARVVRVITRRLHDRRFAAVYSNMPKAHLYVALPALASATPAIWCQAITVLPYLPTTAV